MTLSRGSGPRAAAGLRERVALFGAFLGAFFAAGMQQAYEFRPALSCPVLSPETGPLASRVPDRTLRLMLAYMIGLNVFGLVLAVTFVLGSLLHLANPVALGGLLVGIILAVLAGWRTARALNRLIQ
jgi:hypothetical protein